MWKANLFAASVVLALLPGCVDVADLGTLPTGTDAGASDAPDAPLDEDADAAPDADGAQHPSGPTPQAEGGLAD